MLHTTLHLYAITLHTGVHTCNKSRERKADRLLKLYPCLPAMAGAPSLPVHVLRVRQQSRESLARESRAEWPMSCSVHHAVWVDFDVQRQRSVPACVRSACAFGECVS